MRLSTLLLALAVAVAAVAVAPARAESILSDPFTLPDGTIVDPHTQPEEAREAREHPGSIYTTLSHNGPMGGMGHNPAAGHLRA